MKTVVITGATSGIGLETAKLLANQGFRVLGIGRSQSHCNEAKRIVLETAPKAKAEYFVADLMQQREVTRVAKELINYLNQNCSGELFALINNTGCARSWYMTTEDGYEHQFALNYLAGFLLTYHMLPLLRKAEGRIIMTGSESHKGIKVHWDDVMLSRRYNPLTAYKQSKLCDILFAKGLNDRYAAEGIHAYTIDPGLVKTNIGNKGTGGLVNFIWTLRKLSGISPEIPAKTFAHLCNQEYVPNGLYYRFCKEEKYSKQVTTENADRLFALSERLCGVSYERRASV